VFGGQHWSVAGFSTEPAGQRGGGGDTHDPPCSIVFGGQHWPLLKFGSELPGQHIALMPAAQVAPVARQAPLYGIDPEGQAPLRAGAQ